MKLRGFESADEPGKTSGAHPQKSLRHDRPRPEEMDGTLLGLRGEKICFSVNIVKFNSYSVETLHGGVPARALCRTPACRAGRGLVRTVAGRIG